MPSGFSRFSRLSCFKWSTLSLCVLLCVQTSLQTSLQSSLMAEYTANPDFFKLPDNKVVKGRSHGEADIDKAGNIYVSTEIEGKAIMVFSPEGEFQRFIADGFHGIHGFDIVDENGTEYIYAAHLKGTQLIKLDLNGNLIWKAGKDTVPEDKILKRKNKKTQKTAASYRPTAATAYKDKVFLIDGYASDYIHQYTTDGKYVKTFGGKKAPYGFSNAHKIAVDTRFEPARLLVCDRRNNRLIHLDMEGNFIGVHAKDLRRPSATDFFEDKVVIAEISGGATVLDKEGKVVTSMGVNTKKETFAGNPKAPIKDWKHELLYTPHGISFDKKGNVMVISWSHVAARLTYWQK